MIDNQNSGLAALKFTKLNKGVLGKTFLVAATTDPAYKYLQSIFTKDNDGVQRLYNTISGALTACVSGRGDFIMISQNFTTAPTLTELATANTKKVMMEPTGMKLPDGTFIAIRDSFTSATSDIFTVTGKVKLLDVIGEVTTDIQAQTTNVRFNHAPTVGSASSITANVDANAAPVGTLFTSDGTIGNATVKTTTGAAVPAQPVPTYLTAGTFKFLWGASSTGAVRVYLRYEPLDPGALVFPI